MRSDADARRTRLVELMLSGLTPQQAAAEIGIAGRTVRRYLADPALARLVREAQGERMSALARLALDRADEALRHLDEIADDEAADPRARVMAASATLNLTLRLVEADHLARQVDELRDQLVAQGDESAS